MGTIQENSLVSAQPEQVWNAVIDFPSRPRWSPRVKQGQLLDEGPLREGSRIRLQVDCDRFTSTVVEIRALQQLRLLVKGPGFRVYHTYQLQPSGDKTEASITGDYGGLIGSLVVGFMQRSLRRDLTDELAAIKGAAEEKGKG